MKTIMFEPNTTFLLCSDGITRHIDDHEIRDLLVSMPIPSEICARMKEICYSRGAEDNLTAVIVKINEATNGKPHDFEESTIAAARPVATAAPAAFADADDDDYEIPTQNLQMPVLKETSPVLDKTEPVFIPETEPPPSPENTGETINYQSPPDAAVRDEKTFVIDENKGGSFVSKFLTACLLLILGGIVGAALYYFLSPKPVQTVQEPPRLTQMQSPNIEYTAFEGNRRNVDRDPQQYITTMNNQASSDEDFYLLGRAYLLLGKYTDASREFVKAKGLLSKTSGDKIMLKNEINFGLSIVDSEYGRKFLDEQRNLNQTTSPANDANSNGSVNSN